MAAHRRPTPTGLTRRTWLGRYGRDESTASAVDQVLSPFEVAWLGVEIDEDALAALHEQNVHCGIRDCDDTGYMKTIDPGFEAVSPRW